MKFFSNIYNKVKSSAEEKVTNAATNLVNNGIDQAAVTAAQTLGRQFANPVPYTPTPNQQVIDSYRNQQRHTYEEPLQPQYNPPPVQPFHPQQTYYYPPMHDFSQASLSFEAPVINKLEDEQVKKLAKYKTDMFFQINTIGKNAIRFLGQKFFSHKIEESKQIIAEYEAGKFEDEKAYKKAKYKLEKVAQLENMKDDAEQERIFRDFVADVVLDELKRKNERGELQMPTMFDIAIQQFGFHTWIVFSPDMTLESYLGL